jgi:hypothetical protein
MGDDLTRQTRGISGSAQGGLLIGREVFSRATVLPGSLVSLPPENISRRMSPGEILGRAPRITRSAARVASASRSGCHGVALGIARILVRRMTVPVGVSIVTSAPPGAAR